MYIFYNEYIGQDIGYQKYRESRDMFNVGYQNYRESRDMFNVAYNNYEIDLNNIITKMNSLMTSKPTKADIHLIKLIFNMIKNSSYDELISIDTIIESFNIYETLFKNNDRTTIEIIRYVPLPRKYVDRIFQTKMEVGPADLTGSTGEMGPVDFDLSKFLSKFEFKISKEAPMPSAAAAGVANESGAPRKLQDVVATSSGVIKKPSDKKYIKTLQSNSDIWYTKYLKYKQKYLQLKNSMTTNI
jgi:hypothetical protein